MRSAVLAAVGTLALWGASPASAATYTFTIDNENIISGSAVTPDVTFTVPAGSIFISSATGTINGSDVTGLGPLPVFLTNGDILGADFMTVSGVTYSFDAFEYSSTAGDAGTGTFVFTPSTVPLPSSLPLFGIALLGLGAVGYGLRRIREAAASA